MLLRLIFEDFECVALAEFHAACTEQRADGLGSTALAADDFAEVFSVNSKLKDSALRPFDNGDDDRSAFQG